jgi:TonB-dependent receptor
MISIDSSYLRNKISSWFLLSFFLALQPVLAQGSGSIKGKVVDSQTGDPLIGANVVLQSTSLGAAADLEGRFNIRNVSPGKWTVKVSYIGYVAVTQEMTVVENEAAQLDFRLNPQAITGETVVITAQARGQNSAINQQLASNTISNIVAADRIKELPDANAAESIGRLPGISIDRYNGEATAVAIRGLAPKYNTVTVNGVTLPATNNNDRSVDLSLISSNILDGIEVKKANTPDMDADALGGTIDLRLKEAPEGYQVSAMAQGGFNQREKGTVVKAKTSPLILNYFGNYNGNINVSNRFFDNDLGVIVGFNTDRNNRNADKLNASYTLEGSDQVADNIRVTNIILRREDASKDRLGGNFLLDYRIPLGKVTGNGFYSQGKTDGTIRRDNMDFSHRSHYYNLESNISTTSIFTSSAGIEQDFGWIKYNGSFSATGSKTDDPNDYQWQFAQENNAAKTIAGVAVYPTPATPLWEDYLFENPSDTATCLQSIFINSTRLIENQKSTQFNVQIPIKLTDDVNGYIKTGGKFRWLNRNFDQNQWGHSNLQYGTPWTGVPGEIARAAAQMYPNDFNVAEDSANILAGKVGWMLSRFYQGYEPPSNFLDGQYHMGKSPDVRLLREVTNAAVALGGSNWQVQPLANYGNDYDGTERYGAGYIMSEIKIGPHVTFTPGVRYDADYTKYHGQSFREVIQAGSAQIPSLQRNENERRNSFWLPMVHLNVVPFDWLHIHLAGTETVTRPDYNMYAPITTIDQYSSNIQAANASLRDSRSKNLDASVSIYESHVGFLNVSGFYKKIDDLVLYEGIPGVDDSIYTLLNVNLNIPKGWLDGAQQVNTWINNPSPAQYRGVEFDWQTNFWYLPSVFKGLIFNLNWTYIVSSIDVKQYKATRKTITDPTDPKHKRQIAVVTYDSTSRTQRMPDQPAHIFNTTLGYDFHGFSIRLSYLYQSDKVTSVGSVPLTDGFTAAYGRWDLVLQQKLGDLIQIYANFSNLNNRHDESLLGYSQINPTSLEYYGPTIDIGVRLRL